MAVKRKLERKYFLSQNHFVLFNNDNGRLIPNYAGRSMLDSLVMKYTNHISQSQEGWHASWSDKGIAYKVSLRRINLRPFREIYAVNEKEIQRAKERGDTFLYDEEVVVSFIELKDDGEKKQLEDILAEIKGLGFKSIERKDLKYSH